MLGGFARQSEDVSLEDNRRKTNRKLKEPPQRATELQDNL